jgi:hypothetical protein
VTATDIQQIERIGRREAPGLAAEEYRRLATLAADLPAGEWERPTECPGWTMGHVLAHVAGSMAGTSLREGARQRKMAGQRSKSSGRSFLDEMNELQINERADLAPAAVAGELRRRIAPAVRARRRVPARRAVRLTGTAGGTFVCAGGGAELEVDAVEFCRTLSGRSAGDGLLGTRVVF